MIIVTGGAGLIGANMIWELNRYGMDDILVVDNLASTEKWKNLSLLFSEAERYDGEILLPAAVVFMIPVFLWYLLFHRELREGLKL